MIYRKIAGLQKILNGKLKLWQIFSRRRRWGVGWVRSLSNPSNIFGMALIKLIQAICY